MIKVEKGQRWKYTNADFVIVVEVRDVIIFRNTMNKLVTLYYTSNYLTGKYITYDLFTPGWEYLLGQDRPKTV